MIPAEHRGRLGLSFCEMLGLKGVMAPILYPLKFWLTTEVLVMWKKISLEKTID
jgi:hypothetical protein